MSVVDGSSEAGTRRRNRRLDLRITQSERELIERAIATTGSGLTELVVESAIEPTQLVLADRHRFQLTAHAAAEWEAINDRPARDLPGLRALMERPSPFVE